MTRHYCTHCLTADGKYYDLKTLYERKDRKFVPSGLFQCAHCKVIASNNYAELRKAGNHIVRTFENVEETSY